jgi:hypothetical protein
VLLIEYYIYHMNAKGKLFLVFFMLIRSAEGKLLGIPHIYHMEAKCKTLMIFFLFSVSYECTWQTVMTMLHANHRNARGKLLWDPAYLSYHLSEGKLLWVLFTFIL